MQEQSQLDLIKQSIVKENEVIERRNIAMEVEIQRERQNQERIELEISKLRDQAHQIKL